MPKEDRRFYPKAVEAFAPPEYGIDANAVKLKRIDLTNARATPERIEIAGSMIWAVNATSLSALMTVFIGDAMLSSDGLPVGQGFFLRGIRFSRLYVANTAQPGETITLVVAVEGPDNINIENPLISAQLVALTKATVFEAATDVTLVAAAPAAVLLAANANRRAAIICALETNTQSVRIGDSNTGIIRGAQLCPGESITIETTEAIYGYAEGGANQIFAIAWTED